MKTKNYRYFRNFSYFTKIQISVSPNKRRHSVNYGIAKWFEKSQDLFFIVFVVGDDDDVVGLI